MSVFQIEMTSSFLVSIEADSRRDAIEQCEGDPEIVPTRPVWEVSHCYRVEE